MGAYMWHRLPCWKWGVENLNEVIISMMLLINVQKFNKCFATVAYIIAIIDNLV